MPRLPTGTVTFLFTDIEGSTRLLQELGERYGQVQDDHARILRENIAQGGGIEIRTEGDAFFAVFEDATGAVSSAVASQRSLEAHSWPHGKPLRVRMGLHAGRGAAGGDDYLGIDVNLAARIAGAAHGGQVLLSQATRGLVEHALPKGVRIRDLGQHRLKDIAHPEHLHDLVIDGLASEFPPPRTLEVPTNLPTPLTSFVGRGREVRDLLVLLGKARLVTLTGPGGTGKTRLALEVASRALEGFAGGVFFVDLSAVEDPRLVPSAIAQVLGVLGDPVRPLVETLVEHLRDRRVLLFLDNFEQVVDAADAVERIVAGAREVRALVTSRGSLRVYGEQEFRVEPMRLPDLAHKSDPRVVARSESVQLFTDRARAVGRGFVLKAANAPVIAEICARVDGLPLAIELAASRLRLLPPQAILDRLGQRLPLLTGGGRNMPERQRTLRSTIEWSDELLEPPPRRFLARLSVLSGGCSVDSAEAVANPGRDLGIETLDALGALVGNSLLRRTETQTHEPRFRMLETIREYAAERLRAEGETEQTARRLTSYFLELAEEAELHLVGDDQAVWLDRMSMEHDNVRAALRWTIDAGEAETGLRVAGAIWRFWQYRGYLTEGRQWLRDLLALPAAAAHPAARAKALSAAGGLAYWQSDFVDTRRCYEEAVALARDLGDRRILFQALFNMAHVPGLEGDMETAWAKFKEALAIARELDNSRGIIDVTGALGYVAFARGDYDSSLDFATKAIALAREAGYRFQVSESLETKGHVYRMLGRYEESRAALLESLLLRKKGGNLPGLVTSLLSLAALASAQGHHERAARLWGAASVLHDESEGVAPLGRPGAGYAAPAQRMLEYVIDDARQELEDQTVGGLLKEGRAMTLDEAVAYAGEEG